MQTVVSLVAPGAVIYYAMQRAPQGWLKCDGSEVSIKEYYALYEAIGDTYGKANCPDMFKLPDLRGEFLRSFDDGRGVDDKRAFASSQNDAVRNFTGEWLELTGRPYSTTPETNVITRVGGVVMPEGGMATSNNNHSLMKIDISRQVPTADENRPRNIALLACIKY